MTRVHLVVNPAAGGGTAGTHVEDVERTFRSHGLHVRTVVTRDAEHAVEVAAQADPDDVVAPLGGDGMLGLIARGLAHSDAMMLPLPAGRGNDYVRALGLPRDTCRVARGLPGALERPELSVKRFDVGEVAGKPFLGVVSIGFDARANARANNFRYIRGPLVYTAAGAATLVDVPRTTYEVTVDGERKTVDAWNLAIGNSGRHGGGQRVCPDADLSDGLLDVVAFGGTRAELVAGVVAMRSGRHAALPRVTQRRGSVVHIDVVGKRDPSEGGKNCDPRSLEVYADGDHVTTLPVTITLARRGIRVIVPPVC